MDLVKIIRSYRVQELQALLAHVGKNKYGRKRELQERCIELLQSEKRPEVLDKMGEIAILTFPGQIVPSTSNIPAVAPAPEVRPSRSVEIVAAPRENGSGLGMGTGPVQEQENIRRTQLNPVSLVRPQAVGTDVLTQLQRKVPAPATPVFPDLKMRELPFLEVCSVLMEPIGLVNSGGMVEQMKHLSFNIRHRNLLEMMHFLKIQDGFEEANELPILGKLIQRVKIIVRFCVVDSLSLAEEKVDSFPQSLVLWVNRAQVPLPKLLPSSVPGGLPKRTSLPVDITNMVNWDWGKPNDVCLAWKNSDKRMYAVRIYAAISLTAEDLLGRLKRKQELPESFTKNLIKNITSANESDLCAPTSSSLKVSVICPVGKTRIGLPCRSVRCTRVQCMFDAAAFLLMNEKKSKFLCPVCNKHLKFDDLRIDGYFSKVLKELPIHVGEINVHPNRQCQWTPAVEEKKMAETVAPPRKRAKTDGGGSRAPTSDKTILCIDLDKEEKISDVTRKTSWNSRNRNGPRARSDGKGSLQCCPQSDGAKVLDVITLDD